MLAIEVVTQRVRLSVGRDCVHLPSDASSIRIAKHNCVFINYELNTVRFNIYIYMSSIAILAQGSGSAQPTCVHVIVLHCELCVCSVLLGYGLCPGMRDTVSAQAEVY